ncbi:MAG: MFS transporter [Planctomycetaceae bacterium]
MFGLNCGYVVLLLLATKGHALPARQPRPSLVTLMKRYWPGLVTVVSMAMGLTFTVVSLYLVRFNRHAGIGGIATFWTIYAVAAFSFRIKTAGLSRRIGRYRLIFYGLLLQGLGLWALVPVTQTWHLAFAAASCGLGHALLFPSIVSLGSGAFPPEYRGSGTNLTLGFLDLGSAISAPLMGRIIDLPIFDGAGFRQMFFIAGSLTLSMAGTWLIVNRGRHDAESA